MAAIILPHRWQQQPRGPALIDTSNPLAKGLAWCRTYAQNGLSMWGESPFLPPANWGVTIDGTVALNTGTGGYCAKCGGSSSLTYDENVGSGTKPIGDKIASTGEMTVFVIARRDGTGSGEEGIAGPASGARWRLTANSAGDKKLRWLILGAATNVYATTAIVDGVDFSGGGTVTPSRLAIYFNGVEEAATTGDTINTAGQTWRIGNGQGNFNGGVYFAALWWRALSALEFRALSREPYSLFRPLRRRLYLFPPAAAGQTVTVNQALETDTAQAITRLKAKTLGQATETDLAQAITRRKTLAIGQALETDLAQAVTHAKAKLLGQATETDTAQAVAHAKTKALGQATETDLAQAITASGNKIIAVGQVAETDVAQALTARKAKQLGQTTETDLAQAVAHAKTKALGQATETDLAQAITPSIPNQVGQAVETDTAQTVTRLKAKALGQSAETDLAQAITHAKTKGLGLALEIDLGQPIALAPKRRLVAQATETDLAQTIVPSLSSVQLPQGKRYVVGARVGYRVGARNNFRVDQ